MAKKNILIIQTNKQNLKVLGELLVSNYYKVVTVDSNEELKKIDDIPELHLVLVSANMTFISPKGVVEVLENKFDLLPPIVFVESAKEHDKKMLLECYIAGAVDYIKKPFDSQEILARINSHIHQFAKLCEYKHRVDKLVSLATVDQLSKLSSKVHMQAVLKHQVDIFLRHPSDLAIFYLRLLDVEKVVGAFGFEYGEKLIASFAKELKKKLRESDVIARWAGSDFIVLLPYTDIPTSYMVAKKLMAQLTSIEIKADIKPNIAIGIAELTDDDTIKSIIDKAKNAMGEASKMEYGKIYTASTS